MKTKDIVYLLLAVAILLVAGYIGYTQLAPHTAATKTVQVDVVGPISDSFDPNALSTVGDSNQTADYFSPIDLTTGLGNTAPFGQ